MHRWVLYLKTMRIGSLFFLQIIVLHYHLRDIFDWLYGKQIRFAMNNIELKISYLEGTTVYDMR